MSGLLVGLLCALLVACGSSPPPVAGVSPTAGAPPLQPTPTDPAGTDLDGNGLEVGPAGYVNINAAELASMLDEKDFLLVNTHTPYGYEIAGTDAHIPVDESGRWLDRYPEDRSTKIVLYCRSARWSAIAARELVEAGYTNLCHLEGGMRAWHAAGFPLVGN